MISFFTDKLEYNYECNEQIFALCIAFPEAYSTKAEKLLSHIINAHHIWNARILGLATNTSVWQQHSLEELHKHNLQCKNDSLKILKEQNLLSSVTYKNSKNEAYENKTEDILFHIINHSTYHRAQIMSELKLNGATPISTDFIFFKR